MLSNIYYEKLKKKHITAALELVVGAYTEERQSIPFLPVETEVAATLHDSLIHLIDNGSGLAALCEDKLVGFLAGYDIEVLYGRYRGVYSPLYAHGAQRQYRREIYQGLYQKIAGNWLDRSCMTHAITVFAHLREVVDTWFWLGFGLRCVDAMRSVGTIDVQDSLVEVYQANYDDISDIAHLHRLHNQYYKQSPIFMPRQEEDPVQDLQQWLRKPDHHLWVAMRAKVPMGYMRIEPDAETFISRHPKVMNITGAFVSAKERKSGIGNLLLNDIQKWLLAKGYSLCGVDFESFNPAGSNFWKKHFQPYTYSMVRRIDERINSITS